MSTEIEQTDLAAAWLDQAQGVMVPAAGLAAPARVAERFGAVARAAAARRPFGAEPSGFRRIFAALAGDEQIHD